MAGPDLTSKVSLASLSDTRNQYYTTNTEGELKKINVLSYALKAISGWIGEVTHLWRSSVGMEAKEIALMKLIQDEASGNSEITAQKVQDAALNLGVIAKPKDLAKHRELAEIVKSISEQQGKLSKQDRKSLVNRCTKYFDNHSDAVSKICPVLAGKISLAAKAALTKLPKSQDEKDGTDTPSEEYQDTNPKNTKSDQETKKDTKKQFTQPDSQSQQQPSPPPPQQQPQGVTTQSKPLAPSDPKKQPSPSPATTTPTSVSAVKPTVAAAVVELETKETQVKAFFDLYNPYYAPQANRACLDTYYTGNDFIKHCNTARCYYNGAQMEAEDAMQVMHRREPTNIAMNRNIPKIPKNKDVPMKITYDKAKLKAFSRSQFGKDYEHEVSAYSDPTLKKKDGKAFNELPNTACCYAETYLWEKPGDYQSKKEIACLSIPAPPLDTNQQPHYSYYCAAKVI